MSGTREGERERERGESTRVRFAGRVQGHVCGSARPPRTRTVVGCTSHALEDDVWCINTVPPPQKVTHWNPHTHVALHTYMALHSWQSVAWRAPRGAWPRCCTGFPPQEVAWGSTPTPLVALRHGREQKKGHVVWCHPVTLLGPTI